jgi:DNA-binding transcriptional MerR regulator
MTGNVGKVLDKSQLLRPVDLARDTGLSTQQVRNYEAAGVLPAAPRTPSGYRRYGPRHLRALHTFRALVAGHGRETATALMRAANGGDTAEVLRLVDASHAELHEQRLATDEVSEALEGIAGVGVEVAPGPDLLVGELAHRLGVRPSALRVWEAAGLLTPEREPGTGHRRYGPSQVRDARIVQLLRQSRYPFPRIRSVLDGLRATGDPDTLRAAVAERRAAQDARALAMLAAAPLLYGYLS